MEERGKVCRDEGRRRSEKVTRREEGKERENRR